MIWYSQPLRALGNTMNDTCILFGAKLHMPTYKLKKGEDTLGSMRAYEHTQATT